MAARIDEKRRKAMTGRVSRKCGNASALGDATIVPALPMPWPRGSTTCLAKR